MAITIIKPRKVQHQMELKTLTGAMQHWENQNPVDLSDPEAVAEKLSLIRYAADWAEIQRRILEGILLSLMHENQTFKVGEFSHKNGKRSVVFKEGFMDAADKLGLDPQTYLKNPEPDLKKVELLPRSKWDELSPYMVVSVGKETLSRSKQNG